MRMIASWPPIPPGSTEYKVAAEAPQRDGELPSDLSACRCDPTMGLPSSARHCVRLSNVTVTIRAPRGRRRAQLGKGDCHD